MSYTKSFNIEDIEYISLMSRMQYEDAIADVPNIPIKQFDAWWLQDTVSNDTSYCVEPSSGYILQATNAQKLGIRPYFIFKSPIGTPPGTKIYVENHLCTVITEFSALTDILVEHQKRDADTNVLVFTDSELYEYLNSDEFILNVICSYLPF